MDKIKDTSTLKKGITISIVISILFTCGFILGALTKTLDAMDVEAPVETTAVVTTTQASTTLPPETTTSVPTTAAPETTEAVTEEPTTEPAASEEATTEPSEEPAEEESCLLIKIIVTVLEFFKKAIDFVISILSSF